MKLDFYKSFAGLIFLTIVPQIIYSQPIRLIPHKKITITDPAQANKPQYNAISVNAQKEIYLTDVALNRIVRLDSTGTLIRETGGFGWENEQFDRPLDIWAQNVLDVFVVDNNNHRIQRFDRNLNFVSTFANDSNRESRLQFGFPVAVAFSAFGEIFIAGQEHNRILKIDASGVPVLSFGDYDWGQGSLQQPVRLALSAKNELFVADAMRRAIIKFDEFGNFLQEMRHDAFANIDGLAVTAGHVFALTATSSPRLFVLTTTGEPVTDFDLSNVLQSKTASGDDIAIADKSLYVLDGATATIQCYHIKIGSR